MLKYYYTIIGLLLSHLLNAQNPVIVEGAASFTPAAVTVNYTSVTYVYRASTEVILTPGFEVTQTGNTTTNYFLGYINKPNANIYYAEVRDVLDDSYIYAFNSKVSFKYDEKNAVSTNTPVTFVVYNPSYQPMSVPNNLVKNYGSNYLTLDLVGYAFIQNQYYILEITNEKGEKSFLRFKFQV
jgi:hypothetical protein